MPTRTHRPPKEAAGRVGRIFMAILLVFAIVVLLCGAYTGAYVALSKAYPATQGRYVGNQLQSVNVLHREFPQRWQLAFFLPLAALESALRGVEVELVPQPPPSLSL